MTTQDRADAPTAARLVHDRTPAPAPARPEEREPTLKAEQIAGTSHHPAPKRRRRFRLSGYGASFILLVLAPAAAVIVYLAFLASDQFVAETKFALRTAQIDFGKDKDKSSSSAASSMTSSSTSTVSLALPALSGQDAYVVAAYVRSPAIFADLPSTLNIREIYRRPEADFWARLPSDAGLERIAEYWRSMVSSYVDGLSGIVTVNVRAFRPDDALALAQAITAASEKLVNQLSARARADAMERAEAEVRRAEGQVQDALKAMRAYRDKEGLISPTMQAESTSTLLLNAMSERLRLQAELSSSANVMSPAAPTLMSLRARIASMDQEIDKLRAQLTGDGAARTVSASIARFEELELQRQFAEKLYTMSQEGLERARQKAERQSVYLTAFVPPHLPEEAEFPKRLQMSVMISIGLLLLWGILAMLAATIKDHQL